MSFLLLEPLSALFAVIALWAARRHDGPRPRTAWLGAVAALGGDAALAAFVPGRDHWIARAALALGGVVASVLVARAVMSSLEFRARRSARVQRTIMLWGIGAAAVAALPVGTGGLTAVLAGSAVLATTAGWSTLECFAASRAGSGRRVLGWGMSLLVARAVAGAVEAALTPSTTTWVAAVAGGLALSVVVTGSFLDAADRERAQAPDHARAIERAETAVARARAELSAAFEISTDALHMVDQHLRLLACNETFRSRVRQLTGRIPELDQAVERCYPVKDGPAWEARYQGALAGKHLTLDTVVVEPSGSTRIEAVALAPVMHGSLVVGVVASGRDVTEVRRLAEKLHANAEEFRALNANATDIVLRVTAEGSVSFASPSVERLLGWKADDLAGRGVLMFIADDDAEQVRRALHGSREGPALARPLRFRFRHRAGGLRLLDGVCTAGLTASGEPTVVINARDVTERHAIEAELRRRQRGASVGRLVTGIAHDFNNVLTTVLANASLSRERAPKATDLAEIVIAAERGRRLVRRLQGFAGDHGDALTVFVPGARVAEVDPLLQRALGAEVHITTRLDALDWTVQMDAGQFEQMVVDLALAQRASLAGGGILSLETSALQTVVPLRGDGVPVSPGEYVTITIAGRGTRAGGPATMPQGPDGESDSLEVARAIVAQARGILWVSPVTNLGTTCTVFLPRHHAGDDAPVVEVPSADAPGGTETILIAEDDPSACAAAARILSSKGYAVLVAANGEDALAQARTFVGPIHLLLTDLAMPHVDGVQAARRLRARRGDLRIVLMSGHAAAEAHHGELADLDAGFVAKPFTAAELLTAVRDALDRAPLELRPLSRSGLA
ncbi:MAG: PAS domain S-box protein [Gemmatimonadetes bacterium]|nr:PAS domain S-box protein [Gemmatimonadota bacterium]